MRYPSLLWRQPTARLHPDGTRVGKCITEQDVEFNRKNGVPMVRIAPGPLPYEQYGAQDPYVVGKLYIWTKKFGYIKYNR